MSSDSVNHGSLEPVEVIALLELAKKIAHGAGQLLMDRPLLFDVSTKSSAIDFATQMDIAAEKYIVESILATRPGDGIIGEEGSSRPSNSGITWVIDPLDGTVNYFYGLPGWNVSIAAKNASGVLVGVVCAPTIGMTWWAVKGGGAFCNANPIQVNNPVALDRALVGTGFSYSVEKRVFQAEAVKSLLPKVRDVRRLGAAAVDLCHVASGALDGYFETGLKEWDLAAGGLIATEAGAIVTGRAGGPAGEEMVIAAGPSLHLSLITQIG